jgi:predicted O-methyltransferase YrrM
MRSLSPLDARADAVASRLHVRSERQLREMRRPGRRTPRDQVEYLRDKLIALDPEKCVLAYLLCRATNARRIVELGTSFGVSTIYLAAAVRDNIAAGGGRGVVIGTEIEPGKVAAARANLETAGLARFVQIREGDARRTLRDVGGPVDFFLVDSWIPLARPVLDVVAPQLRHGAIVLCDNVARFERAYGDFLAHVRNPARGFRSLLWPYRGGIELSVRVAPVRTSRPARSARGGARRRRRSARSS